MVAVLSAPTTDAAQDDDSSILAVVVRHGARIRTWVAPSAATNPKVANWRRRALDGGRRLAILTMLDLMALPPV